jgi:hypothetical protein
MNRISDHALTVPVEMQAASQCLHAMYQRLSKSATRPELKRKNSNQAPGAAIANGRFTAIQVPSVHHSTRTERSGSRSWIPWRNSGITSKTG